MKVPPFNPAPARSDDDFLTRAGATVLAERIADAWRRVGHTVEVEVVQAWGERDQIGGGRGTGYAVRTPGLINGLPTRRVVITEGKKKA